MSFTINLSLPSAVFLLFYCKCLSKANKDISFTILEELPIDSFVGDLSKLVIDEGSVDPPFELYEENSPLSATEGSLFRLDSKRGHIFTTSRIDRESLCPFQSGENENCHLQITVQYSLERKWINVVVIVLDINDHTPEFESRFKVVNMPEGTGEGHRFPLTLAVDEDVYPNNVATYNLTFPSSIPFSVIYEPPFSLHLVTTDVLDYETCPEYNLTLTACDGAAPPDRNCGRQYIVIRIIDENDNRPVFQQKNYSIYVWENVTVGSEILSIKANDADSGEFGLINYRIRPSSQNTVATSYFRIIEHSGQIYLKEKLDVNRMLHFSFLVEAYDGGSVHGESIVLTSQCRVNIFVRDVNDHSPSMRLMRSAQEKLSTSFGIQENTPRGTDIALLLVSDEDMEENGRVSCQLSDPHDNHFQLIHSNTANGVEMYRLIMNSTVDREQFSRLPLRIICHDFGVPALRSELRREILVLDENEFVPHFLFSNYTVTIAENYPLQRDFLQLKAEDGDAESKLRYSLNEDGSQYFHVDLWTGHIRPLVQLDREETPKLQFVLFAIDEMPPQTWTASTTVHIILEDKNDCYPELLAVSEKLYVTENRHTKTFIGQLSASDSDLLTAGEVRYSFRNIFPASDYCTNMNSAHKFKNSISVDSISGQVMSHRSFDREECDRYYLIIILKDLGSPALTSSATVTLHILDENDNPPIWSHPSRDNEQWNITGSLTKSVLIDTLNATDPDEFSNANISYSLVYENSFLHLDPFNGQLTLLHPLPPLEPMRVEVRASDNGEPEKFSDISFVLIYTPADLSVNSNSILPHRLKMSPFSKTHIIIAILTGTSIILFLLLVAILFVHRHHKKNLRHLEMKRGCSSLSIPLNTESKQLYLGPPGPIQIDDATLTSSKYTSARTWVPGHGVDFMDINSADSGHGGSEEEQLTTDLKGQRLLHYVPHLHNRYNIATISNNEKNFLVPHSQSMNPNRQQYRISVPVSTDQLTPPPITLSLSQYSHLTSDNFFASTLSAASTCTTCLQTDPDSLANDKLNLPHSTDDGSGQRMLRSQSLFSSFFPPHSLASNSRDSNLPATMMACQRSQYPTHSTVNTNGGYLPFTISYVSSCEVPQESVDPVSLEQSTCI